MPKLLPILLVLCLNSPWVACARVARAQTSSSAAEDRPTQRWIPLPQGGQADLSRQAMLLRQLRDLTDFRADDLPKSAWSAQQLDQMEQAFEALRSQLGDEVTLPNLESIPPEWIQQALRDPGVQQRAQRMLEQYARDRKMPTPDSGNAKTE